MLHTCHTSLRAGKRALASAALASAFPSSLLAAGRAWARAPELISRKGRAYGSCDKSCSIAFPRARHLLIHCQGEVKLPSVCMGRSADKGAAPVVVCTRSGNAAVHTVCCPLSRLCSPGTWLQHRQQHFYNPSHVTRNHPCRLGILERFPMPAGLSGTAAPRRHTAHPSSHCPIEGIPSVSISLKGESSRAPEHPLSQLAP